MEDYYNNTQWKLKVKNSNIKKAGKGVFAKEDIPKESLIGLYEGEITKDSNKLSLYSFEISPRYFIDAKDFPRCIIAMINDARNSTFEYNCEFRMDDHKNIKKRKIYLYAIKDIIKGTELFANYGDDYWKYL